MNVSLVQHDIIWEDKTANCEHVARLVAAASPVTGSLIILPEMFATGFSMDLSATTQKEDRREEAFLSELAVRHQSHVLGGVVSAVEGGRAYNEAVTFGPDGSLVARYAKMRPFSFGGEPAAGYQAGTQIVTFSWQGFTVAPFICYDLRFPELFRQAVSLGADLFIVIASWPARRTPHWLTLLQARAIENQAYVVGVNRTGDDPQSHYCGRSIVIDPMGQIIADAGEGEGVLQTQLDRQQLTAWRQEFPALQDMR